jgi:hypothetical protein
MSKPSPIVPQVRPDTTQHAPAETAISFFKGHELPARDLPRELEKTKGYDAFLSLILLTAFSLFVIVKVYSPRKLRQTFTAFIKPAALHQLLREEYAFSNRSSVLLLIMSLLTLPLFAYQAAGYAGSNTFLFHFVHTKGLLAYAGIMLFVFLAYLVKILTIKFLANTLTVRSSGSEYIYTILLFNKVAGLVMLPLVLLIAFARQLPTTISLYTGLGILSILLIYRSLRMVQIGISTSGVSILYLFLYLCTLEIMPFVVLIKLFMFSFS